MAHGILEPKARGTFARSATIKSIVANGAERGKKGTVAIVRGSSICHGRGGISIGSNVAIHASC